MGQAPTLFPDDQDVEQTLDEARFGVATHLRTMWEHFYPYADSTFAMDLRKAVKGLRDNPKRSTGRTKARFAFQQRYWEMYVGCALLEQHVTLVPRADWNKEWQGAGPDLWATVEGRRVWIECIAPEPGTSQDSVQEIGDEQIDELPVEQIKLRLLSALDTKRKRAADYKKKGIIKPEDAFVVAINAWSVPWALLKTQPSPLIVEALYGLGPPAVNLNRETNEWSDPFLTRRPAIVKKNNEPIEADLFAVGKAREVSGVLYSTANASNRERDPASAIVFVHNHTAEVPLPNRWLPRSVSYAVTVEGNIGTLHIADPEADDSTASPSG